MAGRQGGEVWFLGRRGELAELRGRYAMAAEGKPQLVVVEGPAGIGKTSLIRRFLDGVDPARVLRAGGAERESALPYGVLDQLTGRHRAEPAEPPEVDPLVAGARLLDRIGELQEQEQAQEQAQEQVPDGCPLVIVLDDAHWADAPSLHALTFALRRLRFDRVLALLAVRDSGDRRLPEGLRRIIAEDTTVRVRIGGLTVDEVAELSARIRAGPLPPAAAARLHAHTQGSPLHCRALLEQESVETFTASWAPLPAPQEYARLVLERIAGCTPEARDLVNAAGVLNTPCSLEALARLAGLEGAEQRLRALDSAIACGLLREITDCGGTAAVTVAFHHPLDRAVVYHALGPVRRTRLHTAAAACATGEFAALHHRVFAAHGPDAALAADLTDCARRRAMTGRWAEVASLAHYASRLAASERERGRLAVQAVEALLLDGRVDEAEAIADSLRDSPDHAARCYAMGHTALVQGRNSRAEALLTEAWRLCPVSARTLAARIAEQLTVVHLLRGDGRTARRWAETAMRQPADRIDSGLLRYTHLITLGISGAAEEGLARTAALPDPALVPPADLDLLLGRGVLRLWAEQAAEGRAELLAATPAIRRGPVPLRVLTAATLGQIEFRLGNWDRAVAAIESAASLVTDAGQWWIAAVPCAEAAVITAARGDFDRAAVHLRAARTVPGFDENHVARVYVARARAFLASVRGEPGEVVTALRPLLAYERANFANEPGCVPWRDLLADALIATGAYDEADSVLRVMEELSAGRGRLADLSAACRVRGNLHAARHEPKPAHDAYTEGLGHAARVGYPLHHARLALDFGVFLRRAGRRTAAHEQLSAARTALAELGAEPFLKTCDRELTALGSCPGGLPSPSAARDGLAPLTPQEHAVAQLAATGLSNRQIARELILSVKTVEYHLSHAYAKLGIGSRIGLVGRITEPGRPRTPG